MSDDLEAQRTRALRMLAVCTMRRLRVAGAGKDPASIMGLLDIEAEIVRKDLLQACEDIGREIDAQLEEMRKGDR